MMPFIGKITALALLTFFLLLSSVVTAQTSCKKADAEKAAISFHTRYIAAIRSGNISAEAQVIRGKDGYCQLDTASYLGDLRNTGFFTGNFITGEYYRLSACAFSIQAVRWDDFVNAEAYSFSDNCPQLYFHYWVGSQEIPDGVLIEQADIGESSAVVKLRMYSESGSVQTKWAGNYPLVRLIRAGKKWKIHAIEMTSE